MTNELTRLTASKAESASQERILAAMRSKQFNESLRVKQATYPIFPKSHTELLQRLFILSFNPLAHRILQIPVDLLHQHSTPFQTENPDEEKVLTDYWEDPVNNFGEFSKEIIFNYGQWGEQIFTKFLNPHNKRVRHGVIHPMAVEQTILDPDNDRTIIGIKLRTSQYQKNEEILLTVLGNGEPEEDIISKETIALRDSFFITRGKERVKQSCFIFQENPHFTQGSNEYGLSLRGEPDLTTLYDWVLSTDDILSSMIERADLLSRTLWTLQVTGGNLIEGDEYNLETLKALYGKVPERWEVRVTNDKMKYERHDSPGQQSDMIDLLRSVQLYVISGSGYPEHWFLGGVNANKASSTSMEYPTLKKLEGRQNTINRIFKKLFTYQVTQAGIEPSFKMVSTPLKDATAQTLANALKTLSESLGNAEDRGWLSNQEAGGIYRKLVQELGTQLSDVPKNSQNPEMDEGSSPEQDVTLKVVNN